MVQDDQKIRLSRNLGDALSVIVKAIWPHHTTKHVASECSCDPITARNVVNGVAGGVVLTKFVRSRQATTDDHWDIWIELGRQIFAEDLETYEERKLERLLEISEHAKTNLVKLRAQRIALDEKARAVHGASYRSIADQVRSIHGEQGSVDDGLVDPKVGKIDGHSFRRRDQRD